MALDPEAELRSIWRQWITDAHTCRAQAGSQGFYVDEQNAGGGRNSVMDAEALLCFLQPQASLDTFSIRTGLRATGIGVDEINRLLRRNPEPGSRLTEDGVNLVIELARDYLEDNQRDGFPIFEAESYLDPVGQSSAELAGKAPDTVDSLSTSLSVCLHLLYLMGPSGWGNVKHTNEDIEKACEKVYGLASKRLTAALQGLDRSFAYKENDIGKWEEKTLIKWPQEDPAIAELHRRLERLDFIVNDTQAFECGWSWGPHGGTRNAQDEAVDRDGSVYSNKYPYLYCTLSAIDGIEDLFEPWIETEELLDPEQLKLASRIRNLSDLTKRYWAAIAFSSSLAQPGRWALEALPWRTSDGNASLQWSLYVFGLALHEHLAKRRARNPSELARLIALIEELAERGRLTRTPVDNILSPDICNALHETDPELLHEAKRDPALALHWPGIRLELEDENGDPIYELLIYDFAPQLLKRSAILLSSVTDLELRERLRTLADSVWDQHLSFRASSTGKGVGKYWDFPAGAYSEVAELEAVILEPRGDGRRYPTEESTRVRSWYITQRVCEALVAFGHSIGIRQRLRLNTIETFLRELIDHLANDIDVQIDRSGSSDHERLQQLKNKTNAVRNDLDHGRLTECLATLLDLVDQVTTGVQP